MTRPRILPAAAALLLALPAGAQRGAANGEWRYYGGDAGTTKYSPLDQINAGNVKDLKIVWEWKAQNFGKRPDFNWETTPLEVGGVLYVTAGTRRDAVALDAATGETLWMYRLGRGRAGFGGGAGAEPRPGLLDGRQRRRTHPDDFAGLSAGGAECEDGPGGAGVRQPTALST